MDSMYDGGPLRRQYFQNITVLRRQLKDLSFQSLARIQYTPEWHQGTNYDVVHPEPGELDRMPFSEVESPYEEEILVLHSFLFSDGHLTRSHCEAAAKYLSFETSADLLSYVNIVVKDDWNPFGKPKLHQILGHYLTCMRTRKWLEKLFDSLVEPKLVPITAISEEGDAEICPTLFILAHAIQLLRFAPVHFRRCNSHKTTDSYLRRFPLAYPQPTFNRPSILGGYSFDDLLRALLLMFLLLEQRTIWGLRPLGQHRPQPGKNIVWLGYRKTRSDLCQPSSTGSSTSTQSSIPFMKFPPEVRFMIIECALPTQVAPCIKGEDIDQDDEGRIRFRAIHATYEDTILPLKLSCRYIYTLIRGLRPVEAVDEDNDEVIFRFDFKHDTLRVFGYGMPYLRTTSGQELPLPVQKLLVMTELTNREHPRKWKGVALKRDLGINRFPSLKEFSMICPVARRAWRIEGFERNGPVIGIHRNPSTELWGSDRYNQLDPSAASTAYATKGIPAHTGIKWKFNYHFNYDPGTRHWSWNTDPGQYLGVPHGFCEPADASLNGSLDLDSPILHVDNRAFIPYIGFYGYDRGQCSMGGNWAGFRYFEETGAVFFTPLSWDDVEPLVVGPHGENGKKAPRNEHHPQFVGRVWIIRKGESVPEGQGQYGWMPVEEVMDGDPEWKQQLKSTWMMVRDTFEAEYHHNCGYEFRDTRF
ncbi:hypothetical protein FBULB1_13288 [Fusarium bulbicola]|nr:hypothetical protein FBULB1_13288 [Fusarium bulbicola]